MVIIVGGGDEGDGLITEQTSSSPSHYEFMAILHVLVEIRDILRQGHETSETLRAEAQSVLEAHAEAAQEYMQEVEQPPSPDFHPFISMPAGTTAGGGTASTTRGCSRWAATFTAIWVAVTSP